MIDLEAVLAVERSARLGPTMDLRPATVVGSQGAVTDTVVTFDGDTDASHVMSLVGPTADGQRVMVLLVPPHGAYIVGMATLPAWRAPQFAIGWGDNGGSGYFTAGYQRVGDVVRLRGQVRRTSGTTLLIFTLPLGFRPTSYMLFACDAGAGVHAQVRVGAGGTVEWGFGGTVSDYLSLDSISFSTSP